MLAAHCARIPTKSTMGNKRMDRTMMDVKSLHNEQDYDWAIREIARYFEAEPERGTADGDRFEVLSVLVKEYEDKHFAIPHDYDLTRLTAPTHDVFLRALDATEPSNKLVDLMRLHKEAPFKND